jgi:phospho-N-acetylmuramoyl-pentapeptide-transferase
MIMPHALLAAIWFQIPVDRPNWNMAYSLTIAALGFVFTMLIGRPIIAHLRAKKIGKLVQTDNSPHYLAKMGVPTMGGIMITLSVFILTFIFNLYGRLSMLLPLGVLLCCGILGAVDDRLSLVGGKRAEGMTARFKMAWLTLFSIAAAIVLYGPLDLHRLIIPGVERFDIGLAAIPIAVVGIAGMANAVNLADGLDSLAGGTSAIAFVAYGIIAYLQGQVAVVTFCFTMVGAILGFLWHNAHPAQVIMGDTGSLAIGAALATVGFMTGQWFLLPVVGLVFVAEALSVILQVGYYKRTGGLRLFKRAPLHHHFELLGWSETQVTMRFWLVAVFAGLLGVALSLI